MTETRTAAPKIAAAEAPGYADAADRFYSVTWADGETATVRKYRDRTPVYGAGGSRVCVGYAERTAWTYSVPGLPPVRCPFSSRRDAVDAARRAVDARNARESAPAETVDPVAAARAEQARAEQVRTAAQAAVLALAAVADDPEVAAIRTALVAIRDSNA